MYKRQVNDNEYYTEIDENSSIPQGARQVGWRNFGNSTKPEWAFFNISSGICEVKGQFSKGCEHGKTTYLDYKFKASVKPLNYVYWGNTYRERIDEGVSVWNNATAVSYTHLDVYKRQVYGSVKIESAVKKRRG